jgi:phage tail-like protein
MAVWKNPSRPLGSDPPHGKFEKPVREGISERRAGPYVSGNWRDPADYAYSDVTKRGGTDDPWGNYYFALELKTPDGDAFEVAHFLECSGLKSTCQVFEIEEGGLNGRSHKRPGQSKWENIKLRCASSASAYLMRWRDYFLQDQFEKRTEFSGSIALKNNAGETLRRYHFTNAWPVAWEGPNFKSGGSELAIETLEIAHDGLTITGAE